MKSQMKRLSALAALSTTLALPVAGDETRPRDLTPVTWLDAPSHPPVEIVRDGKARAAVYVADPAGLSKWRFHSQVERCPL